MCTDSEARQSAMLDPKKGAVAALEPHELEAGVNGITGNAGDEMVEPHHERDDEVNRTDGHEELFAVMSGHAIFSVGIQTVDAPAGTLVFVRDPDLIRSARASADGTAILAIGARPGVPFEISRWERDLS